VRAHECFGVGVAVHMQRSCQANTKDLDYIQAWSRSSTRATNLNIPNDDQHESAGGAKEISFFLRSITCAGSGVSWSPVLRYGIDNLPKVT
jgi:hypothetical protein